MRGKRRFTITLLVIGLVVRALGCIGGENGETTTTSPAKTPTLSSSSFSSSSLKSSSSTTSTTTTSTSTTSQLKKPEVAFPENYSDFGGWKTIKVEGTGYFRVVKINGTFWLVDPEGYVFLSKGVNAINYLGDHSPKLGYSPYYIAIIRKYGVVDGWINVTVDRFVEWGFNTVGAWSSPELYEKLPYTLLLDIGAQYGFEWQHGVMPDIFSPDFEDYVKKAVAFKVEPVKDDPFLIGYFTDNELHWGPDWRSSNHLLDDFITLSPDAPGKKVAVDVLKDVFNGSIRALNSALDTNYTSFDELLNYTGDLPSTAPFNEARREFVRRYAERYFSVVTSAIRAVDPNHLILGPRFSVSTFIRPPDVVYEVAGKYVDVISLNLYNFRTAPREYLDTVYNLSGRPIMITEFSFRARDSGLPNTIGAGITVDTQKERAEYTRDFIVSFMRLPYAVGYHWFKWSDEPKEGRFDGENSNYGLVNNNDEPYAEMVEMFKALNREIETIHINGGEG